MHPIMFDDQPASYGLSVISPRRLAIDIHPDAWSIVRSRLLGEVAKYFGGEHLNGATFTPPSRKSWGFGSIMRETSAPDGWTRLVCTLPRIDARLENWYLGYACSITLGLIFHFLHHSKIAVTTDRPQLLTIDALMAQPGMHGASMAATVSPAMTAWTRQHGEEHLPEVQSLMRRSYNAIYRSEFGRVGIREFIAIFREGTIALMCPGNACDLSCDGSYLPDPGYGYVLVCHNTDTPMQQLSFIMGLAAIHDLARKDLWGP